jgi:hypothetical protein
MQFQHNPGIPQPDEYAEYYGQYLKFAGDEPDIASVLQQQVADLHALVESNSGKLKQPHPPYTWSITQAIGHLCDQERVFGNRAGRFASGDLVPLPGYDQEVMANGGGYERCATESVVAEFECLRRSNQLLFTRLNEEQWGRRSECDGRLLSVRAIAYLLAGHFRYHFQIFENRLATAA